MNTQARPDFYTVGGTLKLTDLSYIPRPADNQLFEAVQQREFCYVLTPRQMGKSSLMIRTADRLSEIGVRSVIVDLTEIGTSEISSEAWYLGQLERIVEDLDIQVDYLNWWEQQKHLPVVKRFTGFLTSVMLQEVVEPVVVFVDEIDSILSLPFNSDDYFASIRSLFNQRAKDALLERLTFVLLGVASPSDLIRDNRRTPFNIGRRIHLDDFTEEDAQPLITGLAPNPDLAAKLLRQVLFWTDGHPYLTQKACTRVAQWSRMEWNASDVPLIVDDLVKELFLAEPGRNTDENLQFIGRVLETSRMRESLRVYQLIRQGETLFDNEQDPVISILKLSGLIKLKEPHGGLKVRNPIYERVFDTTWIRRKLSQHDKQISKAPEFAYDVFISYSHRDREWVQEFLVPNLEVAGLRVAIDFRDFRPGAPSITEMERAMISSRRTLLVITPDYVASAWSELENILLQTLDPSARQGVILPLMLRPTELPLRLRSLTYIDFSKKSGNELQLQRLLSVLGGSGHVKTIQPTQGAEASSTIYNTNAIRNLLHDIFAAPEDIEIFVYDNFRPIYNKVRLASSMQMKIQSLIEYAETRNHLSQLLDQVAALNPRQYRKYADLIISHE